MYRVRTVFTGVPGTPWYSNIFFDPAGDAQAAGAHAAVAAFWDAVKGAIANEVLWEVQSEVPVFNPVTGEVSDIVGVTAVAGQGTNASDPLPFQTQGLCRLRTPVVRRNRLIQGRINVPGITQPYVDGTGQYTAGLATTVNAALDGLRTAEDGGELLGLAVWARPREVFGIDIPGASALVSAATFSRLPAVLRSRRD